MKVSGGRASREVRRRKCDVVCPSGKQVSQTSQAKKNSVFNWRVLGVTVTLTPWPLTWHKLTKFNKRIRPQRAADALPVVGDQELFLQLVQEAESQNIWVVWGAHHQVANAQGTGETGTHTATATVITRPMMAKETTTTRCISAHFLSPLSHKTISAFNSAETFFSSAVDNGCREDGSDSSSPSLQLK